MVKRRMRGGEGEERVMAQKLPDDAMLKIFSYTTVRNVLVTRCLDKSLHDSIYNPSFAHDHLELTRHNPRLLVSFGSAYNIQRFHYFDEETDSLKEQFSVTLPRHHIVDRVLPPCNGLIVAYNPMELDLHVCNPAIKEHASIPKVRTLKCMSPHFRYGFGFDSVAKKYKIVGVIHELDVGREIGIRRCDVHTLGTRSWRPVKDACPHPLSHQQSFFLNGSIHWKVAEGVNSGPIIAFDLHLEKFRVISHPKEFTHRGDGWPYLGEVGGKLCLVDYDPYGPSMPNMLDVWLLDDYHKGEWSFGRIYVPFQMPNLAIPVGIWKGNVVFHMRWNTTNRIVLYDPRTRQCTMLHIILPYAEFYAYVYVESVLTLLKRPSRFPPRRQCKMITLA